MSRRHADNWSHPSHYLVDPYTWTWSPNGHDHGHDDLLPPPLCNVNRPSHSEIQLFQNLTMKIHGQGHVWGQRSRSRLTFKIQRSQLWSSSNPLVTFEAWSSIDMFAFRFVALGPFLSEISEIPYLTLKIQGQGHGQGQIRWSHLRPWSSIDMFALLSWQWDYFWLRYSKFYIWPWKFKVKVMAKVKPDGHIWALEFNRYVCFSFRGNQTIFGWDIANSIFDLENSRSRSWPRSKAMVTFEL